MIAQYIWSGIVVGAVYALVAIGFTMIYNATETVNFAVGAFTFALAIGSTIIFGLIPALQVSRPSVNESLQQGAKGSTGAAASSTPPAGCTSPPTGRHG
jgi:uncharacterized integral membrane protein